MWWLSGRDTDAGDAMRRQTMATGKAPMTKAKLRTIADEMFRAWNDHDVQAILDHLTDDVVYTDPGLEEPARGKEAVRAHIEDTFSSFPDFTVLEDDYHLFTGEDESTAVTTWTVKGTMTGSALETGIPATGKGMTLSGTNLIRFEDGLISEYVLVYDALYLLQQLGVMPKTDGLGFKAIVLADVLVGRAEGVAGKAMQRIRR
jgi:steroid delta-isomerase-like uncharacterized protein